VAYAKCAKYAKYAKRVVPRGIRPLPCPSSWTAFCATSVQRSRSLFSAGERRRIRPSAGASSEISSFHWSGQPRSEAERPFSGTGATRRELKKMFWGRADPTDIWLTHY